MEAAISKTLIILACLSIVFGFNQTRIADECLKGMMLSETEDLKCVTAKGVTIQRIKTISQTFYCIKYEKKLGDVNAFDVLSFDLHEDYDLKFTGANVDSNDAQNPTFKLFDIRSKAHYKGKFAFSSDNAEFDIQSVLINGEEQVCVLKNKQVWPLTVEIVEVFEMPTTVKTPATTTMRSSQTTVKRNETTQVPQVGSCGIVKKVESFGNFLSLPSKPGQFPWTVAIYRYFNDEEESYLKCAGTIIDKSTVLTSANCLLEDGLLLKSSELQIYVSPFSLSAKKQKFKIYNVAEIYTHELFFFHLENNIAAIKLSSNIDFNDYVQPICLPEKGFVAKGKLGKFAGFGKSSSMLPPKSDLLNEAEYQISKVETQTFEAENTSGNSRISDLGGGFFMNETNQWTLGGIMSRKTKDCKTFIFTRVNNYLDWIENLNKIN